MFYSVPLLGRFVIIAWVVGLGRRPQKYRAVVPSHGARAVHTTQLHDADPGRQSGRVCGVSSLGTSFFPPSPHHVFSLKESLVRPPLQASSRVGCCPVRWVLLHGDLSLVLMLFIQSSISVDSCIRVHLFGTWGVCLLFLGV